MEITKATHRKALFPIKDGDVTLVFPTGITLTGLVELEEYLRVFLKQTNLSVKPTFPEDEV